MIERAQLIASYGPSFTLLHILVSRVEGMDRFFVARPPAA